MFKYFERDSDSDTIWFALQKTWALFAIALFVVTSRLWLPQTLFPQVALMELFNGFPSEIAYGAMAVVFITLLSILLGKFSHDSVPITLKSRSLLWTIIFAAIVLLWLTDQHRIQPWAVHLVVGALVFITCRPQRGVALLRMLAISIYIYSALGKFDYQFMHSMGPQLLTGLAGLISWKILSGPQDLKTISMALLFTIISMSKPMTIEPPIFHALYFVYNWFDPCFHKK